MNFSKQTNKGKIVENIKDKLRVYCIEARNKSTIMIIF